MSKRDSDFRRRMINFDPKKIDPRSVARTAEYVGQNGSQIGEERGNPTLIPGRGPVSMPVAMPGPPGGGSGMNRYREMTLEEMLLENRVLFLGGEINHVSASRIIMQMLYLQSVKK